MPTLAFDAYPKIDALDEVREPWDRQVGEAHPQYHGFCHFRDLMTTLDPAQPVHKRTLAGAFRQHRRVCLALPPKPATDAPMHWKNWARVWNWLERAQRWDTEVERRAREQALAAQVDARVRHAALAQATLSTLALPVQAALQIAQDPQVLEALVQHGKLSSGSLLQLFAVLARMAQVIPAMVTTERLALGLTTDAVSVEDPGLSDHSFAERVVRDPAATDLAIQLLARLAEPPPPPAPLALGTGTPDPPPTDGPVPDDPPSTDHAWLVPIPPPRAIF